MKYNIVSIKNPKWAGQEETLIDCEIVFEGMEQTPVPFTANKNDCEAHGREVFEAILSGKFGEIAAFVE